MSKLTAFEATFGPLRDVRLDFCSPEDGEPTPFVAVVGANGAGKTSVLEAMLKVLVPAAQADWHLLDFEVFAGGKFRFWLKYGPPSVKLFLGGGTSALLALAKKALYVPSGYLPRLPKDQPLQRGPSASLGHDIALSTDESTWPDRVSKVHQWWLHMHWEYPRTQTLDRLWTALEPFLGDLRYAGVNPEDHLPRFQIDDTTVTFNQLSSGQRRVVLLFMEIAMHCDTDGLLLFDEPEAHFHPGWQRMLPDALGQLIPDGQVFVATHSPFLVEGLAAHQVFLLGDQPW